jgi:transcriptional antiterminator RfaH
MDLWRETNWYAIHTKPSREEVAATYIERLGLEVFWPKMKQEKDVWGTPRMVIRPLFPGYLFARFSPAAHLHSIRYARGVRRVVSAGDVPLPVDQEIIAAIQSRMGDDGCVTIGPTPLKPGDQVIIQEGPLRGLMGVFERELSDHERVMILLQTIEYQARILIEKRHLRKLVEG